MTITIINDCNYKLIISDCKLIMIDIISRPPQAARDYLRALSRGLERREAYL